MLFVTVDSKQLDLLVSLLESTLMSGHVSVDFKGCYDAPELCRLSGSWSGEPVQSIQMTTASACQIDRAELCRDLLELRAVDSR